MENEIKLTKQEIVEVSSKSIIMTFAQYIVPPFGSYIVNFMNSFSIRKIEKFINEINKELRKIKDKDYLVKQQNKKYFTNVFINTIKKVQDEFIEDKIKYFKNYFVNNIKNPVNKENYNERAYYLETLGNMNIMEINLLKLFYIAGKEMSVTEIIEKFGLDKNLMRGFLEKLKSYGFINVFTKGFSLSTDDTTFGRHALIKINELGRKFCIFCINK